MSLRSYWLPRLVEAFGSVSRCAVSHQGMLAGCARANSMMHLQLHGVISKLCRIYRTVQPRVLIRDFSFQWVGKRLAECNVLLAAVRWYCEQVFNAGLILQALGVGLWLPLRKSRRARRRRLVF